MLNEGNQIHNFMSSSGSGSVINYNHNRCAKPHSEAPSRFVAPTQGASALHFQLCKNSGNLAKIVQCVHKFCAFAKITHTEFASTISQFATVPYLYHLNVSLPAYCNIIMYFPAVLCTVYYLAPIFFCIAIVRTKVFT